MSILPADSPAHVNPFDSVLAREGRPEVFEDVAIAAPPCADWEVRARRRRPTIGIVLRGRQNEYGPENCLWERTEALAQEAASLLRKKHRGRVVLIENQLGRSGLPQVEIEAQYAACDLILTSRFHGAMLALRHLVPFIAIDQIQGGAKVTRLVGRTGWPFLYQAAGVNAAGLASEGERLLAGEFNLALADARAGAVERANATLAQLDQLLRDPEGTSVREDHARA